MGFTFDFFVAPLQCEWCDVISPADHTTNMQTYIREWAGMETLTVGDEVDISPEQLDRANYWRVRDPRPDEALWLLECWECPNCGAPQNWALIAVRGGVLADIHAVTLNRTTFERAHYLTVNVADIAGELAGIMPRDLLDKPAQVIRILKERL
ncbi:MAG: hypothetical protein ACE5GS_16975 [Kiloniellaceae bacterium]